MGGSRYFALLRAMESEGWVREKISKKIGMPASCKTCADRVCQEQQNQAKRDALSDRVEVINTAVSFGVWRSDVAFQPSEIGDQLHSYS